MARPVKEIPPLTEEETERFEAILEENKDKKVSAKVYERAVEVFERVNMRKSLEL
ncbi:MAG: hypothetical protein HN842_10100 [Gammaproteobacteria bacterium]|mgnify:CR=1 FL=1|nr:hypothetical protein [Gammaproteobacteria bacterium]